MTALSHWWNRPCGPRDVLHLALPLIVSTMSWAIMHFFDRVFLTWWSADAVAASMPAGMLHWTTLAFPIGLASYANTFVAQYHGARRPEDIGAAVWQGMRIGVYTIPLFLIAALGAPYVFQWAGHSPQLQVLETTYYQVLAFGGGATVLAAGQSAFFTGRGKTRVVMAVDCSAVFLNIVLDYLWIFGHAGFPEMGIAGAAAATALSQWVKVLLYGGLMWRADADGVFGLARGRRFDRRLMGRLLYYGGPNGVQMFVEGGAFMVFTLLLASLGRDAAAATTLAFNVNAVAFVPMIGIGIAVSTLVGQQLGDNRPDLAARGVWTALAIGMAYTGVFALVYVAAPGVCLMAHGAGADPEEFAALRATAVILLRFVAVYCLFDAAQIIFLSAIKGAGDTIFILVATAATAAVHVLLGWIGVTQFDLGLMWCWCVITLWICTMCAVYGLRFWQGRWRTMRVIEPAPPIAAPAANAEAIVDPPLTADVRA